MQIDFHPEAIAELQDSLDWYMERSVAAARGLVRAVDAAIDKVSKDPQRFPKVDRRHQACNLEGYPFQIVYRHEGEKIQVIAIVHAKRRPGYWRARVAK
ncbi:MAG TPA: type II toxin-antitoxin system RelE/ParE family toxin [Thermoguttaceae bacterium]|nr:type II toxin-antitoxin system RelE/ParE family toxin [Thermoguttaceae bacterium]